MRLNIIPTEECLTKDTVHFNQSPKSIVRSVLVLYSTEYGTEYYNSTE